jgi:hypothetical protein
MFIIVSFASLLSEAYAHVRVRDWMAWRTVWVFKTMKTIDIHDRNTNTGLLQLTLKLSMCEISRTSWKARHNC